MATRFVMVRVLLGDGGAIRATRVEPRNENYQLLEFNGHRRYHALTVRGAAWAEIVFTLPGSGPAQPMRVRRMSFAGPGHIASDWCAQRSDGAWVTGNATATPAAPSEWQYAIGDGHGGQIQTHFQVHDDGSSTRVDTSLDTGGHVTGRTVTESRKGARDVETYDANNQKTSDLTERSKDAGGIRTTDRRVDQFSGGTITQITSTHEETTLDARGHLRTTTHTVQEGGVGLHDKTTVDTVQQDGLFQAHSETQFGDGSTLETNWQQQGGHTELHSVAKDPQGNEVSRTDQTSDTWTDAAGTHTHTDDHVESQGKTTDTSTETTRHADGSTETSRESVTTDNSTGERTSTRDDTVKDASGNESTTSVVSHPDGSETVTTTTTDKNGDGTQHTTEIDANGNVTSDETTDVHQPPDSSGSMAWDDGADEGPPRTPRIAEALDALSIIARLQNGGVGEPDEEQSPLVTGAIQRRLRDIIVDDHSSLGWGDAGSEEAPGAPQGKLELDDPPTATDDWGDLSNPRALVAMTARLLAASATAVAASSEDQAKLAETLLREQHPG
jgi:hypothetical protein